MKETKIYSKDFEYEGQRPFKNVKDDRECSEKEP